MGTGEVVSLEHMDYGVAGPRVVARFPPSVEKSSRRCVVGRPRRQYRFVQICSAAVSQSEKSIITLLLYP